MLWILVQRYAYFLIIILLLIPLLLNQHLLPPLLLLLKLPIAVGVLVERAGATHRHAAHLLLIPVLGTASCHYSSSASGGGD